MREGITTAFRWLSAGAFLIVTLGSAFAQINEGDETPGVFGAFQGEWEGSGELLGRPAEFRMRWEVDERGFVQLTFANAWISADLQPTPVLSSRATYWPQGDSAIGVWLDTRPQRLTLAAVLTDNSVVTSWTAEAETGRTEYRLISTDTMTVTDFVNTAEGERLFAEATYHRSQQRMSSIAKGEFSVQMTPQADTGAEDGNTSLGRMSLDKSYGGDLVASATGEMLTAMTTTEGSAGYVAVERVTGTLQGRRGSFVLQHSGTMGGGDQSLSITVVPDSGTGELTGIEGELKIEIVDGAHFYEFAYSLPAQATR